MPKHGEWRLLDLLYVHGREIQAPCLYIYIYLRSTKFGFKIKPSGRVITLCNYICMLASWIEIKHSLEKVFPCPPSPRLQFSHPWLVKWPGIKTYPCVRFCGIDQIRFWWAGFRYTFTCLLLMIRLGFFFFLLHFLNRLLISSTCMYAILHLDLIDH